MHVMVDGWAPDYGSSLQEVEELEESVEQIDADVEVSAARWAPRAVRAMPVPEAVLFVDGVRRIEARLWISPDADGDAEPGLCASYAAGVVRSVGGRATLDVAEVRRTLVSTSEGVTDLPSRLGTWAGVHAKADPKRPVFDVLSLTLQQRLADLEAICATSARAVQGEDADDLLVVDGPLHGRTKLPRAIGMIKSHRAAYLPAELNRVVASLAAGERTPVFRLTTTWERYTWYLRLPGASGSPWAGVVRVECSPDLTPERAWSLASLSQNVLPKYASEPFKDPRAPQNLYPIGGLERALRHRLGDPQLLRRALLTANRDAR